VVERVDEDLGQCKGCNAEQVHEAGRVTLLETLPPDRALVYAATPEEIERLRGEISQMSETTKGNPADTKGDLP